MHKGVESSHCPGLIALAAALLLSALPLQGAQRFRLTDVVFEGNERLGKAQLLLLVGLKPGQTYTKQELRRDLELGIERLYRSGEVVQAGPVDVCRIEDFGGGVRVVVPLKERRRITTVMIRGAKPVGRAYLAEELKTAQGGLLSMAAVRQDRQTMLKRCLAKGFLFAEVELGVDELPGGAATVTFNVFPGPRCRIDEIRFEGLRTVSAGELLDQMKTRERDRWFFGLWRKGYFSPRRLSEDIRQLRAYLRGAKGLLDATVGLKELTFEKKREHLVLTLHVDEGEPYYLKAFDVKVKSLPGTEPRFSAQQLLAKVDAASLVGEVYRGVELSRLTEKIRALYLDAGYLNCRVRVQEPRLLLKENQVTAVIEVDEGGPVYARRIEIRGNTETKDEVIRRELAFMPGELVTRQKLQESMSNLYRLQYFVPQSLDIRPIEATAGQEGSDFLVNVEEGRGGQLLFGVGLASDLGVIGSFVLRKTNFDIADLPASIWDIPSSFSGGGQSLGLELHPGTRYSHYRVYFHEPYVFGHWYGLTVAGSRDISLRDAWEEKEWTGRFRVQRYLTRTRDITVSGGYRYNIMELGRLESDAPRDAFAAKGVSQTSAVSVGLSMDEDLFDPYAGPYKGWRLWGDYEYGGGVLGADVDFSKARAGAAGFVPVIENAELGHHVLTVTANVGWAEPHSDTKSIPIYERFWLGGPYDFRGFRTFGVGPHENEIEVGGTGLLHGTVEYSWPLLLMVPQARLLRGVAFFDWGQLEPRFRELDVSRMRMSAGVGIRISLVPLGMPIPISLYWAEIIEKQPQDRSQAFTFSIGHIGY